MYRAPFDALITCTAGFVLPDTKTFWAFGTQHFRTYQFSCLLLYSANPHITFEIQQRELEVPQECGFLERNPCNQSALETKLHVTLGSQMEEMNDHLSSSVAVQLLPFSYRDF